MAAQLTLEQLKNTKTSVQGILDQILDLEKGEPRVVVTGLDNRELRYAIDRVKELISKDLSQIDANQKIPLLTIAQLGNQALKDVMLIQTATNLPAVSTVLTKGAVREQLQKFYRELDTLPLTAKDRLAMRGAAEKVDKEIRSGITDPNARAEFNNPRALGAYRTLLWVNSEIENAKKNGPGLLESTMAEIARDLKSTYYQRAQRKAAEEKAKAQEPSAEQKNRLQKAMEKFEKLQEQPLEDYDMQNITDPAQIALIQERKRNEALQIGKLLTDPAANLDAEQRQRLVDRFAKLAGQAWDQAAWNLNPEYAFPPVIPASVPQPAVAPIPTSSTSPTQANAATQTSPTSPAAQTTSTQPATGAQPNTTSQPVTPAPADSTSPATQISAAKPATSVPAGTPQPTPTTAQQVAAGFQGMAQGFDNARKQRILELDRRIRNFIAGNPETQDANYSLADLQRDFQVVARSPWDQNTDYQALFPNVATPVPVASPVVTTAAPPTVQEALEQRAGELIALDEQIRDSLSDSKPVAASEAQEAFADGAGTDWNPDLDYESTFAEIDSYVARTPNTQEDTITQTIKTILVEDPVEIEEDEVTIISAPPATLDPFKKETYTVTAETKQGTAITYAIIDGPDFLEIDDQTGEISFKKEIAAEDIDSNEYEVVVRASSGDKYDEQSFTIRTGEPEAEASEAQEQVEGEVEQQEVDPDHLNNRLQIIEFRATRRVKSGAYFKAKFKVADTAQYRSASEIGLSAHFTSNPNNLLTLTVLGNNEFAIESASGISLTGKHSAEVEVKNRIGDIARKEFTFYVRVTAYQGIKEELKDSYAEKRAALMKQKGEEIYSAALDGNALKFIKLVAYNKVPSNSPNYYQEFKSLLRGRVEDFAEDILIDAKDYVRPRAARLLNRIKSNLRPRINRVASRSQTIQAIIRVKRRKEQEGDRGSFLGYLFKQVISKGIFKAIKTARRIVTTAGRGIGAIRNSGALASIANTNTAAWVTTQLNAFAATPQGAQIISSLNAMRSSTSSWLSSAWDVAKNTRAGQAVGDSIGRILNSQNYQDVRGGLARIGGSIQRAYFTSKGVIVSNGTAIGNILKSGFGLARIGGYYLKSIPSAILPAAAGFMMAGGPLNPAAGIAGALIGMGGGIAVNGTKAFLAAKNIIPLVNYSMRSTPLLLRPLVGALGTLNNYARVLQIYYGYGQFFGPNGLPNLQNPGEQVQLAKMLGRNNIYTAPARALRAASSGMSLGSIFAIAGSFVGVNPLLAGAVGLGIGAGTRLFLDGRVGASVANYVQSGALGGWIGKLANLPTASFVNVGMSQFWLQNQANILKTKYGGNFAAYLKGEFGGLGRDAQGTFTAISNLLGVFGYINSIYQLTASSFFSSAATSLASSALGRFGITTVAMPKIPILPLVIGQAIGGVLSLAIASAVGIPLGPAAAIGATIGTIAGGIISGGVIALSSILSSGLAFLPATALATVITTITTSIGTFVGSLFDKVVINFASSALSVFNGISALFSLVHLLRAGFDINKIIPLMFALITLGAALEKGGLLQASNECLNEECTGTNPTVGSAQFNQIDLNNYNVTLIANDDSWNYDNVNHILGVLAELGTNYFQDHFSEKKIYISLSGQGTFADDSFLLISFDSRALQQPEYFKQQLKAQIQYLASIQNQELAIDIAQ